MSWSTTVKGKGFTLPDSNTISNATAVYAGAGLNPSSPGESFWEESPDHEAGRAGVWKQNFSGHAEGLWAASNSRVSAATIGATVSLYGAGATKGEANGRVVLMRDGEWVYLGL